MKLGYSAITWGGVVGAPAGVTSIKDLFYRADGDLLQAIRDIRLAGYQGTEVFDGNLLDFADNPDVLLGALETAGIELVSVYTGANFIYPDIIEEEFAKIDRAARLAREFGAQRLVVGGGAQRAAGRAPGDMESLARGLDRVASIAEGYGLQSSYHPHLGTLVEAPDALEELMTLSTIAFCPDTAHLAAGGGDPVALIKRYADRLAHVHLKDWDYGARRFLPLGEGDLDMRGIVAAIRAVGYDSWLVVELDYYDGMPRAAAEISKRHLAEILG
ncbi:sugar phosphate isomerase/epimerase family protein [Microbacterium aurantiacum]|uniref:sugar phosphate isomerase/epimerase family protein n=1 Tax=Microbacterium aurantiacum TaxID=162393 RepID=UPI003F492759